MTQTRLEELKIEDFEWITAGYVGITPMIRLYSEYKNTKLRFACIECTGYQIHPSKDEAWSATSWGDVVFSGYGFMADQIRHIWFGDSGYFNYPNIEDLILALTELKKLEDKYCKEGDYSRSDNTIVSLK